MELNMSMLRQAVSIFLLAILAACGDGGKLEQKPTAAVKQDTRPYLLANDFSNATWKNGVHQKDGKTNVFYYLHREPGAPTLKAGRHSGFRKDRQDHGAEGRSRAPQQGRRGQRIRNGREGPGSRPVTDSPTRFTLASKPNATCARRHTSEYRQDDF
jgi:hypothetical protein